MNGEKTYTSNGFAAQCQKWMNQGPKRLVFAVGDAYGFSEDFQAQAQSSMALGLMTFPHDLVRLLFAEQLYRAWTILNNEPYHHRLEYAGAKHRKIQVFQASSAGNSAYF